MLSIFRVISGTLLIFSIGCSSQSVGLQSRIDYLQGFTSLFVEPRNIEVWLPRQYFENPQQKFPVLYMHDGQNLFNPSSATYGVAWEVDDIAQQMIDAKKIRPFIVVGVWSTAKRRLEYFPEKALNYFSSAEKVQYEALSDSLNNGASPIYLADEYLQFIVKELKPKIDASYRTLGDRTNTAIVGSSMGGLISMYAVAEYPQVFGQAACISTHWPLLSNNNNMVLSNSVRKYMLEKFPSAGQHRIYYDFGTLTLDQYYEIHQIKVDGIMAAKGYRQPKDWLTRKFPNAVHNEQAWQQRMDVVLEFLFKSQ